MEEESHLRPEAAETETETEIKGLGPQKWEKVVEVLGRGRFKC